MAARTRKPKTMAIEQEYELVPVDAIQTHPDNPRKGAQLEVEVSIDRNGWYGVCTVQKSTGYILAGNHRYLAALAHKATEIPVVFVDVDDQKALRIMLADNRTADLGTYDSDKLAELLESLPTLEGTGYEKAIDDDAEEKEKEKEDKVPEDKYTPMYGVIVVCADEQEQETTYADLAEQGYTVKVVAV